MKEKAKFAARLKKAMLDAGYESRPFILEREFNLRYPGKSVTYQGARRWLQGLSIPEQDKLVCLARWLGVHEHELRYGTRPTGENWSGVREDGRAWAAEFSAEERSMAMMMRQMTPKQRRTLMDIARNFLDAGK